MRLIQIPFSHNCVKVRRTLELKGLVFETLDIVPMDREPVLRASGQRQVPVLVDGDRVVADSTDILLYLESAYPHLPLLPAEPGARAECLVLEDWADATFMELTRRIAYWSTLSVPGKLDALFFPGMTGLRRRLAGVRARRRLTARFGLSAARNARDEVEARRKAGLAASRLGGRPYLIGDRLTLADVGLAAMTYPLGIAAPAVRRDRNVEALLEWGGTILGDAARGVVSTVGTE